MLDSTLSFDTKNTLNLISGVKTFMQRCYGRCNVSLKSILLHGVVSLPDATSYDNFI